MAEGAPRIGVFIPTFRRPDLLRACVLQWLTQTMAPALICVHQNGSEESYEWCVEDLKSLGRIEWIHTPQKLKQHQWYLPPLRRLLEEGCTHFFWSDHDDIYRRDHAEQCIAALADSDFSISSHCGVLYVRHDNYRFCRASRFTSHAPGGMTSSSAFNRKFAQALVQDLETDRDHYYSDNVLAKVTLPRFKQLVRDSLTTVYVSHAGSQTSANWVDSNVKVEDPLGGSAAGTALRDAENGSPQPVLGRVYYGLLQSGYVDITRKILDKVRSSAPAGGKWELPRSDVQRANVLGDPAPQQVKHLLLKNMPDSSGRLVDMVVRDQEECVFKLEGGVLSVMK